MKLHGIKTASSNEQFVQERREQIVKSATRLFARKGYDQTTMKDIGKVCNMTPANLYNYIGKKDDLVTLVIRNNYSRIYTFTRELEDDIEKLEPVQALLSATEKHLRMHDQYRANTYFVTRDFNSFRPSIKLLIIESSDLIESLFEKIIVKGRDAGVFTAEDPWLIARNIMSMGLMWSLHYPMYSKKYNIDQYVNQQKEHVLRLVCCKEDVTQKRQPYQVAATTNTS